MLRQMIRWQKCVLGAIMAFASPLLWADVVEVEGRAPGDAPAARSQALADALREAVRAGAGVDLVTETKMQDFALEFDRAFSKARGYVKKYEVLSTGLGDDGIYVVKIRADVGEGDPDMSDKLTLQMMAREHQAPRVAIRVTEQLEGVQNGTLATDWLRNAATECGLRVVELDSSQGAGGMLSKRAELLGRGQEAAMRSQGIVSGCDYVIEGDVVGSLAGTKSFYGSTAGKNYSLGLNLRVIDAATGVVVVTENAPSRDILIRRVSSDTAAAREAVRQMLEGSPKVAQSDAGWKLIRRIFTHWATEMDLGSVCKLEFTGMDLATAEALKNKLSEVQNVTSIWVRSIDPMGVSIIECEARLKTMDLANIIQGAMPGYKLDRSENRYLSFRKDAAAAVSSAVAPSVAVAATSEQASPMLWVIVGIGGTLILVLLIVVILLLVKNKK